MVSTEFKSHNLQISPHIFDPARLLSTCLLHSLNRSMCVAIFPHKTMTSVCLGFFLHTSSMLTPHHLPLILHTLSLNPHYSPSTLTPYHSPLISHPHHSALITLPSSLTTSSLPPLITHSSSLTPHQSPLNIYPCHSPFVTHHLITQPSSFPPSSLTPHHLPLNIYPYSLKP